MYIKNLYEAITVAQADHPRSGDLFFSFIYNFYGANTLCFDLLSLIFSSLLGVCGS